MNQIWERGKRGFLSLLTNPSFYIYLFAVLLYLPHFLPNLSDITPWDETYYLLSGKELVNGVIPSFSGSPMTAIFYAICYLPFKASPFWLVQTDSLGRFLLFSGLFLGFWQVGKALKSHFNPMILWGLLLLSPALVTIYEYPADPLFITFSALAFSQAIRFIKTWQLKHLRWASFWLGLGMLTRGDALVLIFALVGFLVIVGLKKNKWWQIVLSGMIPFVALAGGYILLRGAITGDFATGMGPYSYTVFEQGQEVDLQGGTQRFAGPTESYYVARQLFGTPEENDYSMFNAIKRNPEAYIRRLKAVVTWIPGVFLSAHYRRYAPLIVLLAIRGLVEYLRNKKIKLALLHLVWFLPFGAVIARTLVRPGYFYMFLFVTFALAAKGLVGILENLKKGWEKYIWMGVFGAGLIFAYLRGEDGVMLAMLVYLFWFILSLLLMKRKEKYPNWKSMAMLLLLVAGFMLKADYRIYSPRVLGQDYRERASLELRAVTEPNSIVLTGTSSVVLMADREVANFSASDIPEFESSGDFIEWMTVQDFSAIYLDEEAPRILWDLVLDQEGKALSLVWSDDANEAHIYLLNSD
ncbi:hypothetical protein JR338_08225 [Chloroflexota bacterium]|nr:hypothetical protein JR338_08225 [Chloroflexota bacterium]